MHQPGGNISVNFRIRKPRWLIGILFVAIVLKSMIHFYYRQLDGDKVTQLAAAVSIAKGNGYTLPLVHADNLQLIQHERLIEWPQFYSYLIAPFLAITNYDYDVSTFIVEVISISVYLSFLLLIFWELRFSAWVCALFLLYRATEINDIIRNAAPTDYLGLGFWLISLYSWLLYLKNPKTGLLLLAVIFGAATSAIRYMYLPLSLILPAYFLIHGYLNKNRRDIYKGWMILLLAGLVAAIPLVLNIVASGKAYYVYESQKGFYWENIQHFRPIFWSALVNLEFILFQLSLFHLPVTKISMLLTVTSGIILIALFIGYLIVFVFKLGLGSNEPVKRFFAYAGALAICNVAVLLYAAVTTSYYNATLDFSYTFLQDTRYFILTQIVTVIFLFYYAFIANSGKEHSFLKSVLRVVLVAICVAECAHGIWFISKRVDNFKTHMLPEIGMPGPEEENFVDSLVKKANSEGMDIVLTGSGHFASYAILKNIKTIRISEELNNAPIYAKKKTMLLIRILDNRRKTNESLLNRKGMTPIGRWYINTYYILYLSPGITPYQKNPT